MSAVARVIPYRRWVFTLNNPSGLLVPDAWASRKVTACVYSEEVGESGTHHLQGYIKFNDKVRMKWVKDTLGEDPHVEIARGTDEECIAYCTKEDATHVGGPYWWPDEARVRALKERARMDLYDMCEMVDAGKSMKDIYDADPAGYARNHRYLVAAKRARFGLADDAPLRERVRVLCVYGPPGIGKSTWVYTQITQKVFCPAITETGTVWFDGYIGEEVLLLDDYKGQLEYSIFNRIVDRWPYMAPVKGGFVSALWTTVVILTNVQPHAWYPPHRYPDEVRSAVFRRVGYGEWKDKDPEHRYVEVHTREEMQAFAAAAPNEEEEEPLSEVPSRAPTPALPSPDTPPHSPSFYAPHP